MVSSFFSTFWQKHDFASASLCLRVVCDRLKLIWLPQSNFTLKSLIVFNRMCLSSGNVYIGPYSPVKWLRSRVSGRCHEGSVRTTLFSHSPSSAHQGMLSIKTLHSKEDYTRGFSLHQCRLYECGIFFSTCICISRFYRVMLLYKHTRYGGNDCWRFPPT